MKHPSARLLLLVCALICVVGAWRPRAVWAGIEMDPALRAKDPSRYRGDGWDRQAAILIDRSRGTNLRALLTDPQADRKVVDTLRTTTARNLEAETLPRKLPRVASDVMLIRRPKAVYAAAGEAMASEDENDRRWGVGVFELVEGRRRGGPSSTDPGPPYRGPERDAALTAAARILTSDPDPELRHQVVSMMHQILPDHHEPSPEELAAAHARETEYDHRRWLLWLMGERNVPAALLLEAATSGYRDPVDVSVGIYDVFVAENRALLEKAFTEGDAVCRAAIGETFYRHQDPMPWARDLILKGLVDANAKVRANFAKGTLVLRPFDAEVRARVEALTDEAYEARWALALNDGREPPPPPEKKQKETDSRDPCR